MVCRSTSWSGTDRDKLKTLKVSLREITADTVRSIIRLVVAPEQERFVANNAISLAEALFTPEAWYRAIYLDELPVGFVMLYDETLGSSPPVDPQLGIWRFMIDSKYQGKGIGGEALKQVIQHARSKGVSPLLLVSYVPGHGSPEGFYRGYGFVPNGEVEDGEIVMALDLEGGDSGS